LERCYLGQWRKFGGADKFAPLAQGDPQNLKSLKRFVKGGGGKKKVKFIREARKQPGKIGN